MKKLIHLSLAILLLSFSSNLLAQCDFDVCPDEIFVDVLDQACDETTGEILNITQYDYDDIGTGPIMDQTEFLGIPGSPSVNGVCDNTEMYGYIDGPIEISNDCQGDGYYSWFERTWEIFDAGGTVINSCVQFIRLVDNFDPFGNVDLVDFFESQDPAGLGWVVLSNDCPEVIDWVEPVAGDFADNCSPGNGITFTTTHVPGSSFDEGVTSITYNFLDQCGNRLQIVWDVEIECIVCNGTGVIYEDCVDAPIVCDANDIDGFTSCTPDWNGANNGSLCAGAGVIHNASYFSFVAGSENITITMGVSNCVPGGGDPGLQANITDLCDPDVCYGGSGGGCEVNDFSFTASGLTIGNVYQLVVDGCTGSECEFSVAIDQADAFQIPDPEVQVAEVETPSSCVLDVNDIQVCPGTIVTFYPDNFIDAEFFLCWSNSDPSGATVQNNNTDCMVALEGVSFSCTSDYSTCGPLELEFTQEGNYEICLVEIDNGCDGIEPDTYCYTVNVEIPVDLEWPDYDICEIDLNSFSPPDHPVTGEEWGGGSGPQLMVGLNTNDVVDDCGCNYTQLLTINPLPLEDIETFEYDVCLYDIVNWVDPVYGTTYNEIVSFQVPNTQLYEMVIVEGGSTQIDWTGTNCNILVNYELNAYDIPGTIVETPGSACDATLSFDIDESLFPDFMTDSQIGYSWSDANGIIGLASSVNVSMAGTYQLIMTYVTSSGTTCTFVHDYPVTLSGSAPGLPTFISNPTETCESQLTGLTYSVTNSAGSTYTWTAANGTITGGQGTSEIMVDVVDPDMPMTITVFASTPGCGDSQVAMETLNVTPNPVVNIDMLEDACVGETVMIGTTITAGSAMTYNWTFDAGANTPANLTGTVPVSWATPGIKNFSLIVVDPGGCESVEVSGTINIVSPLTPPIGMCSETSNSVIVTWTDIVDGQTEVMSSLPGTQTGSTYTVGNLTAGQMVTFTLITNGDTHPCGDSPPSTVTCTASNCTVNPIIETPEDNVCLDGMTPAFQLSSTPAGGTWSGPGVDPISGMFDPAGAIPGANTIMYEVYDAVQDCSGSTSLTITAFENPNPEFTMSVSEACIGEPITLSYEGLPGSSTNWDYGPGVGPTDTSVPNEITIFYTTGGQKIITLEVGNGICTGVEFSLPVEIFPAVPTPVLSCNPTPTSVDVSWPAIPGIDMYDVTVDDGSDVTSGPQSITMVSAGGLTSGTTVTVTVTPIDPNGCDATSSTAQIPCIAQDCPEYTIDIQAIPGDSQCYQPTGVNEIQLIATVTDDAGNPAVGSGVWSDLDVEAAGGLFVVPNPQAATYPISYNFTDDNGCNGVNTIDLVIFDAPPSAFTLDLDANNEVCVGDEILVNLDFAYSTNYGYDLQLPGIDNSMYTLVDNTSVDETYTIVFLEDPGQEVEVTLMTVAGGCTSVLSDATFTVISPLEFSVMDLQECYKIDDEIELMAVDMNGDLVNGSWEIENEGLIPGTTFNPTINDTVYTLIFTEANCGTQQSINVEVIEEPTLMISQLTQKVCDCTPVFLDVITQLNLDSITHVGLNGTPDTPPFSGIPPAQIQFIYPGPGVYSYESIIDRPGSCDSEVVAWEVIVEDELVMPTISCVQTLNSVEFNWDVVPCAEDYTVNYTTSDDEVTRTIDEPTILIDSLAQGEVVDITVTINSSCPCDFPDVLQDSCNAMDCEPLTGFDFIDSLDSQICPSNLPNGVVLTAEAEGVDIDNTGVYTFSGTGVDADGNVDLTGIGPGDYTITVNYLEDGCEYNTDLNYTISDAPTIIPQIEPAPCPESTMGTVELIGVGNGPFVISADNQAIAEGMNELEIGDYTVTITDVIGCSSEVSFTIDQAPGPDASFDVPEDAYTEQEQMFTFDLTPSPESVVWTIDDVVVFDADCNVSDCSAFEFTPLEEKIYEVCVEATYGSCVYVECRDMEAEEFQIKSLYIPNAFNPSNISDPLNTTLDMYIEGCDLVIKDISIYDRWGSRVHYDDAEKAGEDEDVITLWDGTFIGGRDFVPGVYVYVLEIFFEEDEGNGYTEFKSGSITVFD